MRAVPLAGDGGVDRLVDREDLGEPRDLEDLEDAVLGAHQAEVAVVAAQALEPAHEHPETGGVEEVHALQVDDDAVLALTDQLDQPLAEPGRGVDVDLAAHTEHGVPVSLLDVQTEIHAVPPGSILNATLASGRE
jgi:hypothetical protein